MEKNFDIVLKIKKLRNKLNISQERFGKKIGVSGKTVSAYEKGRCEPTLKILDKITEVYGEPFVNIKKDKKADIEQRIKNIRESLDEIEKIFG